MPNGAKPDLRAYYTVQSIQGARFVEGLGLGVGTLGAILAIWDLGVEITGTMEVLGAGTYCIGGICAAMPLSGLRMRIEKGEIVAPNIDGAMWPTAMVAGLGMGTVTGLGFGFAFLEEDELTSTASFVVAGICHVAAIVSYFISEGKINAYQKSLDSVAYLPTEEQKAALAASENYALERALCGMVPQGKSDNSIAYQLVSLSY
jgi:hypothetical protein